MRFPGSPEEVVSTKGKATPHFIADFYASAHFKLTPEKFMNSCDKCFISFGGPDRITQKGGLYVRRSYDLMRYLSYVLTR